MPGSVPLRLVHTLESSHAGHATSRLAAGSALHDTSRCFSSAGGNRHLQRHEETIILSPALQKRWRCCNRVFSSSRGRGGDGNSAAAHSGACAATSAAAATAATATAATTCVSAVSTTNYAAVTTTCKRGFHLILHSRATIAAAAAAAATTVRTTAHSKHVTRRDGCSREGSRRKGGRRDSRRKGGRRKGSGRSDGEA